MGLQVLCRKHRRRHVRKPGGPDNSTCTSGDTHTVVMAFDFQELDYTLKGYFSETCCHRRETRRQILVHLRFHLDYSAVNSNINPRSSAAAGREHCLISCPPLNPSINSAYQAKHKRCSANKSIKNFAASDTCVRRRGGFDVVLLPSCQRCRNAL